MNRNKNLPLTETTYYILLSLLNPAHGYMIMQKVEELSNGQVRLAAGTLYGAIDNLLKLKFIQPVENDDGRRKIYIITETGREVLKMDMERMRHILRISKELIEANQESNQ